MTTYRYKSQAGFTLIEIVLTILIIGVVVSIATKSLQPSIENAKESATLEEMDLLATAIAGDPKRTKDGIRTDFGYVGDIGSLPPDLNALYLNPGGYTTWDGPYIEEGYDKDSWGDSYTYGGDVTITSPGNGSTITKIIADGAADLTSNTILGTIYDGLGYVPGNDSSDIVITVYYPNGTGGMTSTTRIPDKSGGFSFANLIPIGNHLVRAVNTVASDTSETYISVIPAGKSYCELQFDGGYWYSSSLDFNTNAGLVGHWTLDETSGTTASDASGNGNHGTLNNMNGNEWTSGTIDGSLEFNGSDDYVQIGHSDILNGDTALTYCAWVYPHSWSGTRQVMAKSVHGGGSGRAQMGIFSENGQLCGRGETIMGRKDLRTTLTPLNSWCHIALTFNGANLKLYVDGVVEDSMVFASTSLVQTTDPLNFSKRVGTSQYYYDGLIDDVRIYNRSLNISEIQILNNMGN